MKYEWRKSEKGYFLPKAKPALINIPKANYLCIDGFGNPNNQDFANRISSLYSIAYTIKMMPRNGFTPDGYYQYTVYPLEGIYDLSELGRKSATLDKDQLIYTIMIKQPDFVTLEVFNKALTSIKEKGKTNLVDEVYYNQQEDGLSVQMMHIGSYDQEKISFDIMKEFIKTNNLCITTLVHREIYISDFRKTTTDKLKTVLRYKVQKED